MTDAEAIEAGRRLMAAGLELEPGMGLVSKYGGVLRISWIVDGLVRCLWHGGATNVWHLGHSAWDGMYLPDLRDRATFLLAVDQMDRRQDESVGAKRQGRFDGDDPCQALVNLFEQLSKAYKWTPQEQQP